MRLRFPIFLSAFLFMLNPTAAQEPSLFRMFIDGENRCFESNGIPDHKVGEFPTRGNPHSISSQEIEVCVPKKPVKNRAPQKIRGIIGIALNGVLFRPNTAGFWDPSARRQHSRHGDQNWSVDIFGLRGKLGLDFNNAHVGRGGMYHYHGIPTGLIRKSKTSLVGYAGDGFEIHYLGDQVSSGWKLKSGFRKEGPEGTFNGMFNEDYYFAGDQNTLDECNGGNLNGRYVYFITKAYPFVPRCLYGEVSKDFNRSR